MFSIIQFQQIILKHIKHQVAKFYQESKQTHKILLLKLFLPTQSSTSYFQGIKEKIWKQTFILSSDFCLHFKIAFLFEINGCKIKVCLTLPLVLTLSHIV